MMNAMSYKSFLFHSSFTDECDAISRTMLLSLVLAICSLIPQKSLLLLPLIPLPAPTAPAPSMSALSAFSAISASTSDPKKASAPEPAAPGVESPTSVPSVKALLRLVERDRVPRFAFASARALAVTFGGAAAAAGVVEVDATGGGAATAGGAADVLRVARARVARFGAGVELIGCAGGSLRFFPIGAGGCVSVSSPSPTIPARGVGTELEGARAVLGVAALALEVKDCALVR